MCRTLVLPDVSRYPISLEYQAKDAQIIPPRHVKRPASQSPHALAPTAFAAWPAAHLLHTAAPALLQLPLPQSKHHSLRDNTIFARWNLHQGRGASDCQCYQKRSLLGRCTTLITGLPCFTALTASLAREPYPTPWPAKITLVEFGVLSWKSHPIWQSNTKQMCAKHVAWFTFFALAPTLQGEAPWNTILACLAKQLVLLKHWYQV